jgi:4-hydroxybutyrate CoA-transferase
MDWKTIYNQKLTSADEAVKLVKSGNRVVTGLGAGPSPVLIEALTKNHKAYKDVEIVSILPLVKTEYLDPAISGHIRHNSLFVSAKSREAVNAGYADFTPSFLYRIPTMWDGDMPVDVAIIQVSPPDKHGYCSFGISVEYLKQAAEKAKIVLAHVNKHMPRTLGDAFIHVSKMTCIVEADVPLLAPPPPVPNEAEMAIGKHCAGLIKDGDCLQLGFGTIPDAVLGFLKDRKDLGIHTEMFSDGVVDLVNAGVITNARKNFHPGKIIATFLIGSQKLYDFVDDNPMVVMYPTSYTNDPYIAGQNDNLVTVNSCIQVDLLGQVSSETIGMTQFSGVGGQVDFVRASAISKGGRSILTMPSTTKNDTISKIVPFLDEGAVVTTSRCDVHYIVTEFGVANLRNKTTKDRARELIKIAHPKFKDELKAAFKKRFNCDF